MTYPVIAIVLVVLALAVVAALSRHLRRSTMVAIAVTVVVMAGLTAVFDNLMIASDLFTYDEQFTSGITLWLVPVEDFSYPLFCALALPALWVWLRTRQGSDDA